MKFKIKCDLCGKEIYRYQSQVKTHNFCSRKCLADFSNKEKNPEMYMQLKDFANISRHMTELNESMNPTRMDFSTRAKISVALRGKGEGKSYAKSFGIHTHRIIAARKLGRHLQLGEVVHHIDGNKRNNNPDNLMVFSSQAEHVKWHKEHKGGDAQ